MKTAHEWAVELTHNRIRYGTILEGQPVILAELKKAIFRAARDVIEEVHQEAASTVSEVTK
jgi:hypothetical protein